MKLMSKQCKHCSENFSTIYELRVHTKLAHEKPHFKCKVCKKAFNSQATLICHTKTHKSCDSCHKTFSSFDRLKIHIENVHQKNENRPFCCEICGQRHFSSSRLHSHYYWHNSMSGPKHFCNACSKSYKLSYHLVQHIKRCHTETMPKYKCEHCEEEFKQKRSLNLHLETVHEAKCDFACKTCGKRFLTLQSVSCHRRIHTMATQFEPGYGRIQNLVVPKHFSDASVPVDQMEVTPYFSPDTLCFTCPICSKVCDSQTHFIRHLRLLHNLKGFRDPYIKLESNIKCPQCDKSYSRKDLLRRHQLKMHVDKSAVFIPTEFECPYCSRVLKKCAFKDFQAHIKRHEIFIISVNKETKKETKKEICEFYNEKDKTYTCSDCNTKLDSQQAVFLKHFQLKEHVNEYSVVFLDEKDSKAKFQFQCPKCPKSFPNSGLWQRHKDMHNVNRNRGVKRKS